MFGLSPRQPLESTYQSLVATTIVHPRSIIALLAVALAWLAPASAQDAETGKSKLPPADHPNVVYGPTAKNILDVWLAKSDKPAPVLIYFHGGGFVAGSRKTCRRLCLPERCGRASRWWPSTIGWRRRWCSRRTIWTAPDPSNSRARWQRNGTSIRLASRSPAVPPGAPRPYGSRFIPILPIQTVPIRWPVKPPASRALR